MHATHLNRRRWLRTALSLGAAGTATLALPGCGFQLRNRQPMAFRSIQLTGFAANSPLATELARALDASGVSVVGSTLEATRAASSASVPSTHIVFEALSDSRDTIVASPTSYGQVRGITARISLRFAVKRADGTVLVPASDINLNSDLTYNETNALAKMNETAALQKAMQTDLVGQVLRRLAAIQVEQLATPVAPAASSATSASTSASAPRDGRIPSPVRPPASSAL
jgi:LPS-assembly lipoprotein